MQQYQEDFNTLLGVKPEPNEHELALFGRAKKYIQTLSWIHGIEMIAVSNSLSMYATHKDSDIDLFIVTAPRMIWFVRFFVTLRLWMAGVWRHGDDVAGNFCLSFFVTTDALNLKNIAIEEDIYLYYWIYSLKPILVRGDTYERFLRANSWVNIPEEQKKKNLSFVIPTKEESLSPLFMRKNLSKSTKMGLKWIPSGMTKQKTNPIYTTLSKFIRFFLLPRTFKSYNKLGRPEGVIISDDMLKFHPHDRRESIRDAIVKKNFDK